MFQKCCWSKKCRWTVCYINNSSRISFRDAQSYFAVLLDDNNRKTICRLYLNGGKKYFVTLDEQKKEIRNEISSSDDIFSYSDVLFSVIDGYEK